MLKLRYSPTSPYVRKVMMAAHEKGVVDRLQLETTNPWNSEPEFTRENPLSKVPALTIEDGTILFDSPVICEYLDSLGTGPKLFPSSGPQRWQSLRQQALGDGICDAAILRRLESNRPQGEQSKDWMERQKSTVARALDTIEAEAKLLDGQTTIGTIALLAALGYLDFRYGHEPWRENRPSLAQWFERASARDGYVKTAPPPA
jgi:glutathione S-transferase